MKNSHIYERIITTFKLYIQVQLCVAWKISLWIDLIGESMLLEMDLSFQKTSPFHSQLTASNPGLPVVWKYKFSGIVPAHAYPSAAIFPPNITSDLIIVCTCKPKLNTFLHMLDMLSFQSNINGQKFSSTSILSKISLNFGYCHNFI